MDVVLAGLNHAPSGRLLGLSLMAYGDGILDKEELILLGLGLDTACPVFGITINCNQLHVTRPLQSGLTAMYCATCTHTNGDCR